MNSNEQKLTAYALGELNPEESRQIEQQLKDNPEMQKELEDIRAMAQQLETELSDALAIELNEDQRRQIMNQPTSNKVHRLHPFLKLAIAAGLILIFGQLTFLRVLRNREIELASSERNHGCGKLPAGVRVIPMHPKTDTVSKQEEYTTHVDLKTQSWEMSSVPGNVPTELTGLSGEYFSYDSSSGYFDQTLVTNSAKINIVQDKIPERSNTESYESAGQNPFRNVSEHALSTFSIDVDTASYANMRRFLKSGQMPPKDAVRIEEMINYFNYNYAPPKDNVPFAVHIESATCPWNEGHQLVKIGLKGKELDDDNRKSCNLVFLMDVSGSMSSANKLPLVKKALKLLVKQLDDKDRVAIVVYAGASGLVLPATSCGDDHAIASALDRLNAGGSTNGGAGIELAYAEAMKNYVQEGVNRVILCTDGDFNVGLTGKDSLIELVQKKAQDGVFLTVLGFGMGNYKDDMLEQIADKGNGNYAYIDSFSEARKNLAEQAAGTLFTIAKDVKLQIEFNPALIDSYRLIGYENRVMAKEDFNDDKKDAGELGAGHTVTAFYELVPVGAPPIKPAVDPLKYQPNKEKPVSVKTADLDFDAEWLSVKLRYKLPDANKSTKIEIPYSSKFNSFERAGEDFRFATSVAAGGMLMRNDDHVELPYSTVIDWAAAATGKDTHGYRREYLDLLRNAAALAE